MGYYYHIGEAILDYEPNELVVQISVESIVGDADAVSKGVRQANWFNSSATFFNDAIETAGLGELFFGRGWSSARQEYLDCSEGFHRERPLIGHGAPCTGVLCQKDLDMIREALAARRASLPPGTVAWDEDRAPEGDEVLMLLEWLDYWIERTLRTCKIPIFAVS